MDINSTITKNITSNLLKSNPFIINELTKVFGEKYRKKVENSINNTIILYIANLNTIYELLNNEESLDNNTIKVLNAFKENIENEISNLNEEEALIGTYNQSSWQYNQKIVNGYLENKLSITLKNDDNYYVFTKIDIFDNNANEDYILEIINNFSTSPNLDTNLSNKYGKEFADKYLKFRIIVANVLSTIVAKNLSKKEIHLFSKNKEFNYYQGREELLEYAFEEDLGLILSNPFELIDKVGVDNLSDYIDNLNIIMENNSMDEIDKENLKNLLDKIRSICHQEITIDKPLLTKQIKELQEKKEKLKTFPEFDKENPVIAQINNDNVPKTLPKLDISTFNDIANKANKKPSFQDILNDKKNNNGKKK